MRKAQLLAAVGGLLALTPNCGQRAAGVPAAATGPDWQTDPALEQVRQQFGAPNQNIILNPNAIDVATTPSVADVQQVLPDQLVIAARNAAWLLARHENDVLYCSKACGGDGFLRRVVSIQQSGNSVVVQTTQAYLTDIVWQGWIHGSFDYTGLAIPPTVPAPAGAGGAQPGGVPSGLPAPRETPPPAGTPEKTTDTGESGGFGGSIGLGVTITAGLNFDAKFIFDMAVKLEPATSIIPNPTCTACWTCVSCDAQWALAKSKRAALDVVFPLGVPQLTYFRIELDPTAGLDLGVDVSASATGNYKKNLAHFEEDLAALPIGPVTLNPAIAFDVDAVAQLSGSIALGGHVKNNFTAKLGAEYANGAWSAIKDGSKWHSSGISANASDTASAKAVVEVKMEPKFETKLYGILGPTFGPEGGAGVEAEISDQITTSHPCPQAEFSVDAFVEYGVQCGFDVSLFPHFELWDQHMDVSLWSEKIDWEILKKDLGNVDSNGCGGSSSGGSSSGGSGSSSGGSSSGGSNGSGSSSGGSSGGATTGGGSSGGGSTSGGNISCNSPSDCSGSGACSVCIKPADFCGGSLGGSNFCSTNIADTVGMTCSSSTDCDPCGTGQMKCASCSSLSVGCSGQCCQY